MKSTTLTIKFSSPETSLLFIELFTISQLNKLTRSDTHSRLRYKITKYPAQLFRDKEEEICDVICNGEWVVVLVV